MKCTPERVPEPLNGDVRAYPKGIATFSPAVASAFLFGDFVDAIREASASFRRDLNQACAP
jgi:hypothetical protein